MASPWPLPAPDRVTWIQPALRTSAALHVTTRT
jgi:hypothetical protein